MLIHAISSWLNTRTQKDILGMKYVLRNYMESVLQQGTKMVNSIEISGTRNKTCVGLLNKTIAIGALRMKLYEE